LNATLNARLSPEIHFSGFRVLSGMWIISEEETASCAVALPPATGIYSPLRRGNRSVEKGVSMQAAVQVAPESVRAFIQEYFDAWKGTDEHKILAYFSDDVVIHLPTGTLEGKTAVRDNFVRPFIGAFPGNVHSIRNLAHAKNLVAVEWSFEAVHKGAFAKIEATGKKVQVPGCSVYEYDLGTRKIPVGRIYFDFATLLRQIGAGT
jgi:steroid delta-isomerase-like uncharacterized protein